MSRSLVNDYELADETIGYHVSFLSQFRQQHNDDDWARNLVIPFSRVIVTYVDLYNVLSWTHL